MLENFAQSTLTLDNKKITTYQKICVYNVHFSPINYSRVIGVFKNYNKEIMIADI